VIARIGNFWRAWKPPFAWAVGALALAGITFVLVLHELYADQGGNRDSCKKQLGVVATTTPVPPPGHARRGTHIRPVGPNGHRIKRARMTFTFKKNREPLVRTQAFRVPRAMNARAIRVGTLTDASATKGEPTILEKHLIATVKPSSVGHRFVTVRACVDPDKPEELDRGQYAGALVVQSPQASGVKRSSIALAVSVHDNHPGIALFAVLIGVMAGLVIRSAGDLRKIGEDVHRDHVKAYVYSLSFLVMVAGGLLGGATAYLTIYANDFNATTDTGSLIAMAGAAFTATIAAKTLTDLGSPTPREQTLGIGRRVG
jgi:hypothetical protein